MSEANHLTTRQPIAPGRLMIAMAIAVGSAPSATNPGGPT